MDYDNPGTPLDSSKNGQVIQFNFLPANKIVTFYCIQW